MTLLTTENYSPQKHLINMKPANPRFGFPGVEPPPSSSSTIEVLIKVCCSRCGYPAALPATPTLMRMYDAVVYPPTFFPLLLLLLQGSSSFRPPYSVEKDECFLPDISLHSPLRFRRHEGTCLMEENWCFSVVFLQNKFKPDDRWNQIYV